MFISCRNLLNPGIGTQHISRSLNFPLQFHKAIVIKAHHVHPMIEQALIMSTSYATRLTNHFFQFLGVAGFILKQCLYLYRQWIWEEGSSKAPKES